MDDLWMEEIRAMNKLSYACWMKNLELYRSIDLKKVEVSFDPIPWFGRRLELVGPVAHRSYAILSS
jgi:hypothetical protein